MARASQISPQQRREIKQAMIESDQSRLTAILKALGIAASRWYRQPVPQESGKRPGPAPQPIPPQVIGWVLEMAKRNPWYGYKRIAVMCRRAERYQTAKLFELLPHGPNELWQMDVTYVHIPGYGWWYAVTVIDYYSRYLLAAYLTWCQGSVLSRADWVSNADPVGVVGAVPQDVQGRGDLLGALG